MKNVIVIALLALSLGCATSITGDGLRMAWGDSSIGTDCDGEGVCGQVVEGGSLSGGFVGLLGNALKAAISVLPFADSPQPDRLTVVIENADE